jgi:hypothetical protein
VLGVELIEQLALDLLARHAGVLANDALLDHLAQLGERFHAERLANSSSRVISLRRFDRLRRDVEFGVLAGEMRLRIGLREGHIDGALSRPP